MKKKRVKSVEPHLNCIAYLSTTGDINKVEFREKKQLRYIKEYAAAHNITITKVMHRDVLGQQDVNYHYKKMIELIYAGQIDGIMLANMHCISTSKADAYYKVGLVDEAGGTIVTVDEGRLKLKLVGDYDE